MSIREFSNCVLKVSRGESACIVDLLPSVSGNAVTVYDCFRTAAYTDGLSSMWGLWHFHSYAVWALSKS